VFWISIGWRPDRAGGYNALQNVLPGGRFVLSSVFVRSKGDLFLTLQLVVKTKFAAKRWGLFDKPLF
jgi:hypothetical protein